MSEVSSPTESERRNRLNLRNLIPILALGGVAVGGVGAAIGREAWPAHPNGLTVEIAADGPLEHFQINNTVTGSDEPGLSGLNSHTDQLLAGTLDCSYVNKDRTAANIDKAVQITIRLAGSSQSEAQLFQGTVLDNACNSDGTPKRRSGWDIARAYVTSGMSDDVYLG